MLAHLKAAGQRGGMEASFAYTAPSEQTRAMDEKLRSLGGSDVARVGTAGVWVRVAQPVAPQYGQDVPETVVGVDETVVVVLSEMGRTPHLNAGRGKDHWSHTSVMLCGGGVSGGRVIGGYSDVYTGQPVDPATGAVTDSGIQLSPETLGASLLHLGGVSLDEGVADDIADAQALTCIASS